MVCCLHEDPIAKAEESRSHKAKLELPVIATALKTITSKAWTSRSLCRMALGDLKGYMADNSMVIRTNGPKINVVVDHGTKVVIAKITRNCNIVNAAPIVAIWRNVCGR